jgi:outer membrane biosynthesis protein TonB
MAIAAVRTWRFKPALGPDGKPVTVNAPIEVTFRLY